jgi:Ca2+-binding RTX toxin-like protein
MASFSQTRDLIAGFQSLNLVNLMQAVRFRESDSNYQESEGAFIGAYQFGRQALETIGYVTADGALNDPMTWVWTGRNGIDSFDAFLGRGLHTAAEGAHNQDLIFTDWLYENWAQFRRTDTEFFGDQVLNGVELSVSALTLAAHLVGGATVRGQYLGSGGVTVPADGNNVPITEFIDLFGDFDITDLTDLTSQLGQSLRPNFQTFFTTNPQLSYAINGGAGADVLKGFGGNDRLIGEAGNDSLYGGDGADILNGGVGDDFIFGGATSADLRDLVFAGAGNDSVDAGYGNDEVFGQGGNDTIVGGFGSDTLQGQDGNDVLTGSALSDLIFGNAGNDFVNGGFGHDRINGGTGADRFFHLGILDHGSDFIQDYNATEGDRLLFGVAGATRSQFQININDAVAADGEKAGDDTVQEVFVIYRPTGQIMWALIDGAGQNSVNLQLGSDVFDILM